MRDILSDAHPSLPTAGADHVPTGTASPENIPIVFARLRTMKNGGYSIDNLPQQANINPTEYMLRFLDEVRERYGRPREWLLAHGLDEQELDQLRDNLTETLA